MTNLRPVVSGRAAIAVEIGGTGAPIVFLHAGVADRRMWRDQVDALARSAVQFLAMNEIALRSEQRGTQLQPPSAYAPSLASSAKKMGAR